MPSAGIVKSLLSLQVTCHLCRSCSKAVKADDNHGMHVC